MASHSPPFLAQFAGSVALLKVFIVATGPLGGRPGEKGRDPTSVRTLSQALCPDPAAEHGQRKGLAYPYSYDNDLF